jgi:hypothetical protein
VTGWDAKPAGRRKPEVVASGKPKSRNRELERLRSQEARAEDMMGEVELGSPGYKQRERTLLGLRKRRKRFEKVAKTHG